MLPIGLVLSILACQPSTGVEDSSSLTGQDTDDLQPDSSVPEDSGPDVIWDRDQDGYPEDEDCNDYDDSVFPGASEE